MENVKIEKLVRLAKTGNTSAISTLMETIHDELNKIAILKLSSKEDAGDAVQEAELSIYNNIKNIKQEKYFKTWAVKILINECNKIYLNREKEKRNINKMTNTYKKENYDISDIDDKIDANELINSLNNEDKIIVKLYLDGYKTKEIADILNMNENSIKTKIRRAKNKMKDKGNMNKYIKTAMLTLLIIAFTTGLVYASIIIIDKIKGKTEPIKWDTVNITMNVDDEAITNNMIKYGEETYLLLIKDMDTLLKTTDSLNISYENDYITKKDIFTELNYDILLIIFNKEKRISVQNVLPYEEATTIVFKEDETQDLKRAFCILVPQNYYTETFEIEYTSQKQELAKEAESAEIKFKYIPLYLEKVDNFYKMNLIYNDKGDYYFADILDENEYMEITEHLGIMLEHPININIVDYRVKFIFKTGNNKLQFKKFYIKDNIAQLYLTETEEKYGDKITGGLIVVKKGDYESININID